jgi:hypothetical protein
MTTPERKWEKAQCKNCMRKMAERREIIKSGSGLWVHNNPLAYNVKCHPFEEWVAEPMEEE